MCLSNKKLFSNKTFNVPGTTQIPRVFSISLILWQEFHSNAFDALPQPEIVLPLYIVVLIFFSPEG